MNKVRIVIATIKSWNIFQALSFKEKHRGKYEVEILTRKEDLNFEYINKYSPDYIFFTHWSWIIPEKIFENFECVVFHMTDLPYGRGGSPLQNLILRKIYTTKISAIRVEKGLDAGKIYLKKDLYIGLGSAEEIFIEASKVTFKMIGNIVEQKLVPQNQQGDAVYFKRRNPEESDISLAELNNMDDTYDFIRMLDGEGYPKAFLKMGKFKLTFSDVHKKGDKLSGRFEIENE
ncbi:methionyl-tRNA formyltransferase [Methanosarcina sp. 2.H.A.1B.4]|uniref:methionyl-tRNA formyltransferase n=1 Tax=Methanosarcina sp. 2.H.A.1B.4 TaxID=1483600 RepID=UPI000621E59C|nr:methionyl-tRNA formyltransferase [Methanosarcina sp. 2.H.A.1B.4]KKG07366.1 methionyl-tRNA formyltransferase [Methanosarcina sp. 2.H.A.1B.4]